MVYNCTLEQAKELAKPPAGDACSSHYLHAARCTKDLADQVQLILGRGSIRDGIFFSRSRLKEHGAIHAWLNRLNEADSWIRHWDTHKVEEKLRLLKDVLAAAPKEVDESTPDMSSIDEEGSSVSLETSTVVEEQPDSLECWWADDGGGIGQAAEVVPNHSIQKPQVQLAEAGGKGLAGLLVPSHHDEKTVDGQLPMAQADVGKGLAKKHFPSHEDETAQLHMVEADDASPNADGVKRMAEPEVELPTAPAGSGCKEAILAPMMVSLPNLPEPQGDEVAEVIARTQGLAGEQAEAAEEWFADLPPKVANLLRTSMVKVALLSDSDLERAAIAERGTKW